MFQGFNIENTNIESDKIKKENWTRISESHKSTIQHSLEKYIIKDGVIDGEKIQDDWFPEVKADIFISHSHDDAELAINLACWLYETFNLVAFIDSCVWGYANDLLMRIDNKYCRKKVAASYDYNMRNCSTSHVHMMLLTALNKMIDKTECIFFLNTENSVSLQDIENKTLSPWIYSEIEITRTIRKKIPQRRKMKYFSSGGKFKKKEIYESLKIAYPLKMDHLINIDYETLNKWQNFRSSKTDALDKLYEITGLISTKI